MAWMFIFTSASTAENRYTVWGSVHGPLPYCTFHHGRADQRGEGQMR